MKKKYILAGLLLVGGIAFIKFILPKLNKKTQGMLKKFPKKKTGFKNGFAYNWTSNA